MPRVCARELLLARAVRLNFEHGVQQLVLERRRQVRGREDALDEGADSCCAPATVTEKEPVLLLPELSVAVQCTVVVPIANVHARARASR